MNTFRFQIVRILGQHRQYKARKKLSDAKLINTTLRPLKAVGPNLTFWVKHFWLCRYNIFQRYILRKNILKVPMQLGYISITSRSYELILRRVWSKFSLVTSPFISYNCYMNLKKGNNKRKYDTQRFQLVTKPSLVKYDAIGECAKIS